VNDHSQIDFSGLLIFWTGATIIMAIIGRFVFREQIHEWRTLRMLTNRISPFFPEFDPVTIRGWVDRASLHVWKAWRTRELGELDKFSTPAFLEDMQRRFAEDARRGLVRDAQLLRLLKTHPLGLVVVGQGPPPAGLELVLRVEVRAIDCVRDPSGTVVEGKPEPQELQLFWTLRHDGRQWWLNQVRPATEDRTDLAKMPAPPPLMEWRRPEGGTDGAAS
jgi:hypothetical protein